MTLKTFNLNEEIYNKYSGHCKKHGISMSKQVEKFIAREVASLSSSLDIDTPETQKPKPRAPSLEDAKRNHPMSRYC